MIYIGFMMGLMGSLHCLGMCGPIAFALPVRTSNRWVKLIKYLMYNLGRIVTYSILGLLIGIVGEGLALAGLQQIISVTAGLLIIVSIVFIHNPLNSKYMNSITNYISGKLKSVFRFYLQKPGLASLFILGILNGILPCGMVYMAMLGALSTGGYVSGALFMASFGLGTLPMMLSISLMGNLLGERLKSLFYKCIPVLGCLIGLLLIIRGLNVEIPLLNMGDKCCHSQKCH